MATASAARPGRPSWRLLLRPKWLCWHAFAVLATAGMLYLGRWQLLRAESGNELSWAYTFEWPIFAVCGVYFWVRTIREELRLAAEPPESAAAAAGRDAEPDAQLASEDYAARLQDQVRGHGRWHGLR
jgi:hypothetical protein